MWRDARQDARWWEAALYRMVGRGGIWTTEEIKLMADYLGTDFGPNAKPPERAKQYSQASEHPRSAIAGFNELTFTGRPRCESWWSNI